MPTSKKPRHKKRGSHQHEWQRYANRFDPTTKEQLYRCVSCPQTTTNPFRTGRIGNPVPASVQAILDRLI